MPSSPTRSQPLHLALWLAQGLLGLGMLSGAALKLAMPAAQLNPMMPWTGQYPTLVKLTGVIDLLGGLGVLLPALLRIRPDLTVLAALGCAALQGCAIAFHLARGEAVNTPFNFVLLGLALFVWWGRRMAAPIVARGA